MAEWRAAKAGHVLRALLRVGWSVQRRKGSHVRLAREGWRPVTFAFHDAEEIGPVMLRRISKETGLRPEDL